MLDVSREGKRERKRERERKRDTNRLETGERKREEV